MKSLKVLMAAGVLMLAGCGGESIQSPDFTSELDSIVIGSAPATAPLGRSVQLSTTGRFTTPPGSSPAFASRPVAASYTVEPASTATVGETGVFVGRAIGIATVTASFGGKTSAPINIQVTAPVLEALVVTPATVTIGLGTTQTFTAQGRFSDSDTPRGINTPITWTSDDVAVATVLPPTGPTTVATGVSLGTTQIRASTVDEGSNVVAGAATLTVGGSVVTGLLRVEPVNGFVAQGFSRQFVAIGSFSDNTQQPVMSTSVDWSSGTPAVATIDATGLATGVTQGQSVITATLKPEVVAAGDRDATATLTVTDRVCTTPLLATAGATVTSEVNGLCVGCGVDDPAFAIDALPLTAATIRVPLALLGGSASLTATAAVGDTFPGGQPAGFIVRRPAGLLLTAELLSQLSISTLNNGLVRETSREDVIVLRVTLLGILGEDEAALVSFTPTLPFDALRLELNSGVASALTLTQVASACATAVQPPASP
ncbi:MAG: Ig-like domain-containing protein [Panacagrimonas sp.]